MLPQRRNPTRAGILNVSVPTSFVSKLDANDSHHPSCSSLRILLLWNVGGAGERKVGVANRTFSTKGMSGFVAPRSGERSIALGRFHPLWGNAPSYPSSISSISTSASRR